MSDRQKWELSKDCGFHETLAESLPDLPPDDVAAGITPWRRAMAAALWGLALHTLVLNIWLLGDILPIVGAVLMVLGFRALRWENCWFRACWLIAILQTADLFPILILNTTIYANALPSMKTVISVVNLLANLAQIVCLWRGFLTVRAKAQLPRQARPGAALILWYIVMCLLALIEYEGIILALGICAAYFFILYSLFKLSRELDEAGYTICPAPVKVPDKVLAAVIFLLLGVGIFCGYLFGSTYPMNWTEKPSAGLEVAQIREELVKLDFPRTVLNDISEEDIFACKGALQVEVSQKDFPMSDGRMEKGSGSVQQVHDAVELRVTGVAVELPDESKQWKIFHHFQWITDPGFYGTETIQLLLAYDHEERWEPLGGATGQVLCTVNGEDLVSPYHSLGQESYDIDDRFWGPQRKDEIFAEFSMPGNGLNQRGYVSYELQGQSDSRINSSLLSYTHQDTWAQYPVQTAKEWAIGGSQSQSGAFRRVFSYLLFQEDEALQ